MSTFENIKKAVEVVSKELNLSEKEKEILFNHKSIQTAKLNVEGNEYEAFRIIHNNALGPGKGGIRFHPDVSEDGVKSLSFWMSIKNSLLDLPYGGAKGGVKVNLKDLDKKTIEKISREYIKKFHEFIGENKDVPAPDVYTNPEIMGWMLDEYEKIKKRKEPAMITGKPLELGGINLRTDATSKGGVIILEEFLKKRNLNFKELKIAIQGFGNAGMNVAKILFEKGHNIVAISDSKGGIYSTSKLNITKLIKHKLKNKTVLGFENSKNITNEEILELNVDFLILAALENQITKKNADKIKAKNILELANGPITSEADEILFNKDISILPDILANAGGVVASYCEWCQNKSGGILDEEYLNNFFESRMRNTFEKIYYLKNKKKNFSFRSVCYILSIKNILNAEKARGNLK